jgi:hypothetical protein
MRRFGLDFLPPPRGNRTDDPGILCLHGKDELNRTYCSVSEKLVVSCVEPLVPITVTYVNVGCVVT